MALTTGHLAAGFALEIDGKIAGSLTSFEGGEVFAEVMESPGTGGPPDKSIGTAQYGDIVVTCPLPGGTLGAWVTAFLEGKALEHDGAVILLNLNRQPLRRLEWQRGTIFSVAFPSLDASAGKQVGQLTIAIRPTTTKDVGGSGQVFTSLQVKSAAWLSGNFALSMPGLDCTRVVRVEPVVVTQTYVAPASGRGAPKPGPVHVSDLVVTIQQSGVADFVRWVEDFVVSGNNSTSQEKDATVRFLAANLRDEVGSLRVLSTGIFRMDHVAQVEGLARTAQVKFSMYAKQVRWPEAAEPAVPTAAPTAPPSTHRDVRDVLGMRLAPAEVVRRLREEQASEERPGGVENQRRFGREVGLAWAQRHASLAELKQVAAADDQDWSSLSLPAGHSLAETLAATGDIPLHYDGGLELPRDALAEGLLAGVLEALAELNGQVDLEKATTIAPAFRALPPEQQKSIAKDT
jgi:hypothetical protein